MGISVELVVDHTNKFVGWGDTTLTEEGFGFSHYCLGFVYINLLIWWS